MMGSILFFFSFFGILLSGAGNQETGWSYDQATGQSFFLFESIQIDGQVSLGNGCLGSLFGGDPCDNLAEDCGYCCENPGSCDVIGAFYNDVCIGWVYADASGYTTVPAMGQQEDYPYGGEIIEFRIYDSTEQSIISFYVTDCYNVQGADLDCTWTNNEIKMINPISFQYPQGDDDELFYDGDISIINFLDNEEIPSKFDLLSAYPNPFNPSVNIDFYIESNSLVDIKIYDILGNLIDTLILNDFLITGNHSVVWNPNNISTGEYIISLLINGSQVASQKVAYIK